MGYMGLACASESDTAAGLMFTIGDAIAKQLAEELEDEGNCFNTSGAVNCGFFVRDVLVPAVKHHREQEFYIDLVGEELVSVLKEIQTSLEAEVKDCSEENKEEWEDQDNRKEHFNCYKSLLKAVEFVLSEVEDEE